MEMNVKGEFDMFDTDNLIAFLVALVLIVLIVSASSCHYAGIASHNKCVMESSEASAQFCQSKI